VLVPRPARELERNPPDSNILNRHSDESKFRKPRRAEFLSASLNISQLNRKRLSLHGITLLTRKKSCHEGEQPYDYRV